MDTCQSIMDQQQPAMSKSEKVKYLSEDATTFDSDGSDSAEEAVHNNIEKLWNAYRDLVFDLAREACGVEKDGEIKLLKLNDVLKELKTEFGKYPKSLISMQWKDWSDKIKQDVKELQNEHKEQVRAAKLKEKEEKGKAKEKESSFAVLRGNSKKSGDAMEVDEGSSSGKAVKAAKPKPNGAKVASAKKDESKDAKVPAAKGVSRLAGASKPKSGGHTIPVTLHLPTKELIEMLKNLQL